MKREVSFFKDRRASGASALLDTMRAIGMSDKEIKTALLKQRADEQYEKVKAARSIGPDAVSAEYNKYRDYYAEYYKSTLQ